MGQISVEITRLPGSVLRGNQQPAALRMRKCSETVDCARPTASTISPPMQPGVASSNRRMRSRAGCASAFASSATWVSASGISVLVFRQSSIYDQSGRCKGALLAGQAGYARTTSSSACRHAHVKRPHAAALDLLCSEKPCRQGRLAATGGVKPWARLDRMSPPERFGFATGPDAAMVGTMRTLITCLCLFASPGWAWDFTPRPICTLSWENDDASVVVTYDPRAAEYAITLRRTAPWPREPIFAIEFHGARGFTISTSRHRLSEAGQALTVTDRGFGNVLDGLQYNDTATALTGSAAMPVPLDGAAPAVEAFRDCARAPSV